MQPAQQDIINRIKQVNNILVTVKANPTVDDLSAALGLTIALNNFGKHATAVFSGQIPNAMSFLKPEKTFENDVHSLRDFIISLNKDKADKLRFAKDGDIVKIYITPYKATITSQDLSYTEGDFNVEMVLAIGISSQQELDSVIATHGRILHEATVATIMPGTTPSQLGSINWSEPDLTSDSAMAFMLLQNLGLPNGISPEIATALLTGIVADTDKFSNKNTSPKIMQLSAQLMSSGADHQLVTSSIGLATLPQAKVAPSPSVADQTEPQEITLDLHEETSPSPITPTIADPAAATNTAPMATADIPAPSMLSGSVESPATPTTSPNPLLELSPQINDSLNSVLPQPVDISTPVVPAELLPPQPELTAPIGEQPTQTPQATPTTTPIASPAPNPDWLQPNTEATTAEADKILSEIDDIYNAQPFDPANNPRQDLGTNIINPEEDHSDQLLPSSALAVDTSVQEDQALASNIATASNNPTAPSLPQIEATKEESVNPNDILGTSPIPNNSGLPMPDIAPPPPPPPPIEGVPTFNPTVDFNDTQKL